jgi:hypothetical protein
MWGKRFTAVKIINMLREAEVFLSTGKSTGEVWGLYKYRILTAHIFFSCLDIFLKQIKNRKNWDGIGF